MEMWMSLPRGQRRATIVLLALVLLLCGAQVVASMWRTHNNEATADYTMLEQEIEQFRSQLDTMSLKERKEKYWRRTHARPDTSEAAQKALQRANKKIKERKRAQEPAPIRPIVPVPRIIPEE